MPTKCRDELPRIAPAHYRDRAMTYEFATKDGGMDGLLSRSFNLPRSRQRRDYHGYSPVFRTEDCRLTRVSLRPAFDDRARRS